MNSHGAAKIRDVLDYLLNEDGLYQYIRGAVNPKAKKTSNEPDKKGCDFINIKLLSNLQDEEGNRV